MKVTLISKTTDAEEQLAYMARVSNPDNQDNPSRAQLIRYLIKHNHWSPFEMVNMCVEIECPRDIGRQILRHRSFTFQEFSQRYQTVGKLPVVELREARMQDSKNRQNSLPVLSQELQEDWESWQTAILELTGDAYKWALERGIAKECARVVLPEGLTNSRMYMTGNLRSWLHFVRVRMDPSTQKEHRLIAVKISELLYQNFPFTMEAFNA